MSLVPVVPSLGAVQFWCSAQEASWTWVPRAYVGVWLIMITIAVAYSRLVRHAPAGKAVTGWIGVALLWAALDWPIGPLSAGYLMLAHSAQFLIVTMMVPPLMLLSVRDYLGTPEAPKFFRSRLVRVLTLPLLAAIIFNLVAIVSHAPPVVDRLMVSQIGAFAIDVAWLLGGLIFWWPVLLQIPGQVAVRMPMTMLYLLMGTLFHTGIAVAMLCATYPIYRVYELAPPMSGLSALDDQQLAGGIMELGGAGLIILVVTVFFFRWANERADMPTRVPGKHAH